MIKLKEDTTIIDPIPTPAESAIPEITEEEKNKACELATNSLIQAYWDVIAQVNALISTIDFEFAGDKEEIKKILTSIIDDSTISIGMLYKIIELLNEKTTDLIDAGQEKAEEIISDNSEDVIEKSEAEIEIVDSEEME